MTKSRKDYAEYEPTCQCHRRPPVVARAINELRPILGLELAAADVLAKKEAAEKWCVNASAHAQSHKGKKWRYGLIPHDAIAVNMTLEGLVQQHGS